MLIGLPTLRLRGDYLAIVTLGFGEIIPQFVRNGDHVAGFNLTNGSFGLTGIDGLGFGNGVHSALPFLPSNFVEQVDSTWYYWTALVLLGDRDRRPRCCCATRASGAPGSRSARTRTRPPRWASR